MAIDISETEWVNILGAAKSRLEDGWCKGSLARDSSGRKVSPDNASAACFCMLGAIAREMHERSICPDSWRDLVDPILAPHIPAVDAGEGMDDDLCLVAAFNDYPRTQLSDVLAVLDKAIDTESVRGEIGAQWVAK